MPQERRAVTSAGGSFMDGGAQKKVGHCASKSCTCVLPVRQSLLTRPCHRSLEVGPCADWMGGLGAGPLSGLSFGMFQITPRNASAHL